MDNIINNPDTNTDPDHNSDIKITNIDKEFICRVSFNADIPVIAKSKREAIEKLQESKFGIEVHRDNTTVVEIKDLPESNPDAVQE